MKSLAQTPVAYLASLPIEKRKVMVKLRKVLNENLPKGFFETMDHGMLGFVVPHSIFPAGYHVDPKSPLPFINLAAQKNHIALYHMGLYEGPLLEWWKNEWTKHVDQKLDMGKCCIRFKKMDTIPYESIGKLARKMTPRQWVKIYQEQLGLKA